jgi:hypothetical protein
MDTLSVISLHHVSVLPPPFNDGMRCIAYDFQGGFENDSYDHKDEEGKEVPNIREYYYNDDDDDDEEEEEEEEEEEKEEEESDDE